MYRKANDQLANLNQTSTIHVSCLKTISRKESGYIGLISIHQKPPKNRTALDHFSGCRNKNPVDFYMRLIFWVGLREFSEELHSTTFKK